MPTSCSCPSAIAARCVAMPCVRRSTRSPPPTVRRLFAIVATSGTTNVGVVDDLPAAADAAENVRDVAARRRRVRRCRARSAERPSARSTASNAPTASSSTPTSGCSPRSTPARCCTGTRTSARAAHTQHAEYLDVLHDTTRRAVECQRLRPSPLAPRPRPAAVVQPRHARHRCLHRGRRDHAADGAGSRAADRASAR